jgi:hypothetical protein
VRRAASFSVKTIGRVAPNGIIGFRCSGCSPLRPGAGYIRVKDSREFSVSKEELSPEDQAYYKRFEVTSLRVLLYFLAVVYLVFVFAVGGSQFRGGFFSGAVGSFILIQGIDLSNRRLIVIGGFLIVVSILQTISLALS